MSRLEVRLVYVSPENPAEPQSTIELGSTHDHAAIREVSVQLLRELDARVETWEQLDEHVSNILAADRDRFVRQMSVIIPTLPIENLPD